MTRARRSLLFAGWLLCATPAMLLSYPMSDVFAAENAAAEATGEDVTLDLLKRFREEFIKITPGEGRFPATFKMGDDAGPPAGKPAHEVKMGKAFEVAKYEVPQNLWQAVMGKNPSKWKGPRNSVEMLTLDEAQQFCQRATERMRSARLITDKQTVRLPTEAEWEYVARAGTTTKYSFGDDAAKLNDFGWYTGNAAGNDPPVGAKKPNDWGLYDVHGYLWEWCADVGHPTHEGAPADGSARTDEPTGDTPRGRGVLRSGSWKDKAEQLTSGYRRVAPRDLQDDAVGLRCVLSDAP